VIRVRSKQENVSATAFLIPTHPTPSIANHGTSRFERPQAAGTGRPAYRNAPQNIEAEQAVLGAIIVNNEAFYRVSDFLEPQHFFRADPSADL
jgi:Replicative DNA helicase